MPVKRSTATIDRALWAALLAAALVRAAAVLWLGDTIPYSDYFYYHEAGRMQAADWGFLFRHETVLKFAKLNWWPPGYPLFLAALYSLAGVHFRVAVFAQVVLGVLTCAFVYAFATRAAGRRAGLIATWLIALDPTYVFTCNLIASENLFAPLLALGLWLAVRDAPGPGATGRAIVRHFAPAGVVLGLATLVRAAGLCVPWVVAVWLWKRTPDHATAEPSAAATDRAHRFFRLHPGRVAAVAVLGAFFLTLAPWTARNAFVAGSPALVCFGGGLNFYFGQSVGPLGYRELSTTPLAGLHDVSTIDRRGYALGLSYIAHDPLGFVTRGVRKIGALFAPPTYALHANSAILIPDPQAQPELAGEAAAKRARQQAKDAVLHGPLAFVAALHTYLLLAGAVFVVWRGSRSGVGLAPELWLAASIVAVWIVVHAVFWAQPRFRYPIEIPMAVLAAATLRSRYDEPRAKTAR